MTLATSGCRPSDCGANESQRTGAQSRLIIYEGGPFVESPPSDIGRDCPHVSGTAAALDAAERHSTPLRRATDLIASCTSAPILDAASLCSMPPRRAISSDQGTGTRVLIAAHKCDCDAPATLQLEAGVEVVGEPIPAAQWPALISRSRSIRTRNQVGTRVKKVLGYAVDAASTPVAAPTCIALSRAAPHQHCPGLPDAAAATAAPEAATLAACVEDEIQLLLQPGGRPCFPMEAAWMLDSRASSSGAAPDSHRYAATKLDQDDGEVDRQLDIPGRTGGAAGARGSPLPGHTGSHRACEFGYTASAPVNAATLTARDLASLFLQAAGRTSREPVGGLLSAPAGAASTKAALASDTELSSSPAMVDYVAERLTPEAAAIQDMSRELEWQVARAGGATAAQPRDSRRPKSRRMASAAAVLMPLATMDRMPESARRAQAGSSSASGYFDNCERGAVLSSYFGTSLTAGLSSLLVRMAVEPDGEPDGAAAASPQSRTSCSGQRDASAWGWARGRARRAGRGLFSCFTEGSNTRNSK